MPHIFSSADRYIQHNPFAALGVDELKGLSDNFPGNHEGAFAPIRFIGEDDLIVTHRAYENFGPAPPIAFNVFRIDNGKVVENWDNMSPLTARLDPSGQTQIDGEANHHRSRQNSRERGVWKTP